GEAVAYPKPLFSPKQIGWAAFFGSLFAGVLLLQANYRVMGRRSTANQTLGLGFLATVAISAVLFFVSRAVSTPINIFVGWAMYKVAVPAQGEAFKGHMRAGGARRSGWMVFGVIMATAVGLIAVVMAIVMASGATGD